MKLAHTIDEGLSRFQLVNDAGDGEQTACAMSLLNWVWRKGVRRFSKVRPYLPRGWEEIA